MSIKNKLYLVTGASIKSAIGLAICKKLDQEGATLILISRDESTLEETRAQLTNSQHYIEAFDLTQLDSITEWVKGLVKQYGAFDGLVYNAGQQGSSPLRMLQGNAFMSFFGINCFAPLMLAAALAKPKNHKESASFVFIGSAAGLQGVKGKSLYAASKAALHSMTQSMALELADKGIRTNYIAPALVLSPSMEHYLTRELGSQQLESMKKAHPLGFSLPTDVANGVYFLLSELSRNVTGTSLIIDGGYLAGYH